MAKLTKRTTEQLRSYLSSLSADELMEVLLSHAARDDELRDRLLIESAERGAGAVDLRSFQRSINAAVFDLAESRYGSEYTSGEWAYGVNQVAQRLGELLDVGQAAAAVTLAEHAVEALVDADDLEQPLASETYDKVGIVVELLGSNPGTRLSAGLPSRSVL